MSESSPPHGEKEFLVSLGQVLHPKQDLSWRQDSVAVPLSSEVSLLYSMDRPERIFDSGDRQWDLRCFGRWSAALVASDVIASGAEPRGISFDVGMAEMTPAEILVWAEGVLEVCGRYSMQYEGGNLGIGAGVVGVAWGTQQTRRIIRRSGATEGALLLATAVIGTGWARRLWMAAGGDTGRLGSLHHYQEEPWVNLAAFREVWATEAVIAGMDLTDGIAEFGYEILDRHGLGVVFDPTYSGDPPLGFVFEELGLPPLAGAFEAGYDTPFSHGWCVLPAKLDLVTGILRKHSVPFTVLGRVDSRVKGVFARRDDGTLVEIPRYWDDVFKPRGSIDRWRREILPLFV